MCLNYVRIFHHCAYGKKFPPFLLFPTFMPDTIKYLLASMLEKYFATSDFNDNYQTHLTCYADTLFI